MEGGIGDAREHLEWTGEIGLIELWKQNPADIEMNLFWNRNIFWNRIHSPPNQPIELRTMSNMLRPTSTGTGCFAFSSACSTNSAGNSLKNVEGWHGVIFPNFLRPAQWLMDNVCMARVMAT